MIRKSNLMINLNSEILPSTKLNLKLTRCNLWFNISNYNTYTEVLNYHVIQNLTVVLLNQDLKKTHTVDPNQLASEDLISFPPNFKKTCL